MYSYVPLRGSNKYKKKNMHRQVFEYICCHLYLSSNYVSSFLEYDLYQHLKAGSLTHLPPKASGSGNLARPLPAPESMPCTQSQRLTKLFPQAHLDLSHNWKKIVNSDSFERDSQPDLCKSPNE